LLGAIGMNGRFMRAATDLLYRAEPYDEYMQERKLDIQQALAQRQMYLSVDEYRGEYPRSIYYNDIRPDPRDWRNVCYAQYYGLRGIRRLPVARP